MDERRAKEGEADGGAKHPGYVASFGVVVKVSATGADCATVVPRFLMRHVNVFSIVLSVVTTLLAGCSSGGSGATTSDSGSPLTPSGGVHDAGGSREGGHSADHDAGGHVGGKDGGAPRQDGGGPPPGSDAGHTIDAGSTDGGPDGSSMPVPTGLVLSPYKDTSINMNWNTNVITTDVPGTTTSLATDLTAAGGKTVTLAFATGECGSESWAGVAGATMATANVPLLTQAGVQYIVSTGGADGSFTCGTDAGMSMFIDAWASSGLIGVDFDIEAGQTPSVIQDLVSRVQTAHGNYPTLRFSLTLATLATNNGASTAGSLGAAAQDSFNTYGDEVMAAVKSTLGFDGTAATWPSYVTVNLMTMDYGSASDGVCIVSSGACDMGQSALQAAYNLHDVWGVPYGAIELTPMIGQNDASTEQVTLQNADVVAAFALSQGLAGVHYWSYDRDVDCDTGSASPTCNSMGSGYAGPHGFLKRLLADGL